MTRMCATLESDCSKGKLISIYMMKWLFGGTRMMKLFWENEPIYEKKKKSLYVSSQQKASLHYFCLLTYLSHQTENSYTVKSEIFEQ